MTINNPTMSMKAVTISTQSFLPSLAVVMRRSGTSVGRGPAERRGRHRASHHPRQRDDREQVRDHLDELRRDRLRALELDLQRFGGGEQQTREARARGVPA